MYLYLFKKQTGTWHVVEKNSESGEKWGKEKKLRQF